MLTLLGAAFAHAGGSAAHNLDGHNISLTDGPGPVLTGVIISTDGKVYQHTDDNTTDSTVQIDSTTDWIIPNAAATTSYWVRASENSQTGGGTLLGTLATWLQISSNREWSIERQSGSGDGVSIWNLTVEISTDSGGSVVVASGTYVLTSTIPP